MWRMGWWNVLIRSVRLIIGVFYSSRVRDARRALVTGVQTCALPICTCLGHFRLASVLNARTAFRSGMTPRQQGYGTAAPSVTPNATVPHGAARRGPTRPLHHPHRSEEHTSELQSLMRISYAVFCLKKKQNNNNNTVTQIHQYNH